MEVWKAIRKIFTWRREQRRRETEFMSAQLYEQWERDTVCGTFRDRATRDAYLAKHLDWRESFTGSIDEFVERDAA